MCGFANVHLVPRDECLFCFQAFMLSCRCSKDMNTPWNCAVTEKFTDFVIYYFYFFIALVFTFKINFHPPLE